MELNEAITRRRSTRRFTDREISREVLEEIISAGNWAPSACDRQSWKFIIIDSPEVKQRIVDEGGSKFINDAPAGILVLYDNRSDDPQYQDYVQSASAAIQNMLLRATSLGVGSCWVCHLPLKDTLREILKIPRHFDPIAYIALGYAKDEARPRPRKNSLVDIVSRNKFDFKTVPQSFLGWRLKKIISRLYFRLPLGFKKALRPIAERFVKKFD